MAQTQFNPRILKSWYVCHWCSYNPSASALVLWGWWFLIIVDWHTSLLESQCWNSQCTQYVCTTPHTSVPYDCCDTQDHDRKDAELWTWANNSVIYLKDLPYPRRNFFTKSNKDKLTSGLEKFFTNDQYKNHTLWITGSWTVQKVAWHSIYTTTGKILTAFKMIQQCNTQGVVSYATNNLEASIIILCPPLVYNSDEFSFPLLLRSSSYDCVIYWITIF
jgi:hypothetical protein